MNDTDLSRNGFAIAEIAAALDGEAIGDGAMRVTRLRHPAEAGPGELAMAMSPALLKILAENPKAEAAVIPAAAEAPPLRAVIRISHPRGALQQATALFDRPTQPMEPSGDFCVIHESAEVHPSAHLGPFCQIGPGARIGAGCFLEGHVSLAAGAILGEGCRLASGARIGPGVRIGARAILHANVVIGADGFSFLAPQFRETPAFIDSGYPRVASLASVRLGKDVEIGAGTTIDRGTLSDTLVGDGTKLDNLVHLAHNVTVGENCLLCAQVGVAGSAEIGPRCILGGKAGVGNHVRVGADCMVGASSSVAANLRPGTIAMGTPAWPQKEMQRIVLEWRRLPKLADRVAALEEKLLKLER